MDPKNKMFAPKIITAKWNVNTIMNTKEAGHISESVARKDGKFFIHVGTKTRGEGDFLSHSPRVHAILGRHDSECLDSWERFLN